MIINVIVSFIKFILYITCFIVIQVSMVERVLRENYIIMYFLARIYKFMRNKEISY